MSKKEKRFVVIGAGVGVLNVVFGYLLILAGAGGTAVGLTAMLMLCLGSVVNYFVNFRQRGPSRRSLRR